MSLDSLKEIGAGASTKFVLPFELTKLFEGAADYVGYARKAPDRQLSDVKDVEVKDLSGAGDTFLAGLACTFLNTNNIEESIKFANTCATSVVQKKGVTVLSKNVL